MRFTSDVDIPEELVTAAADGSLVLFVGAGVSLNPPSDLPLFDGLAARLASLNGEKFGPDSGPPDSYLGRLIDREPAAREQARQIIGSPTSGPNENHEAIVRLASLCGSTRVITTNFDEHLAEAAALAGIDLGDRFNGPAVPLARNFSGLVHLHGAVSRPVDELVLTDDDFGRAYLTDGWARRFVQELLLNRVVLFIGYSHEDTVMKYLARGLPPTSARRYVLTDIAEDSKWAGLHITPVSYPPDNRHSALTAALNAWADRLAMGQLDHRARVKAIIRGGPPKTPVEDDYLRDAITHPVGVRAFFEEANGKEWLDWIEQHPSFIAIFSPGSLSADSSEVLTEWLGSRYFADDESADLGFGVLARLGPVVSENLMSELARAAYYIRQTNPSLWLKLSVVIAAALRTDASSPDKSPIILHGAPVASDSVLPFLRRAVVPRLILTETRPWLPSADEQEPRRVVATIAWSISASDAKRMWEAAKTEFVPIAIHILHTFEQALRDAYDLLNHFDSNNNWDSWSFGRSAIEPHPQDRTRDVESILIDGLRDSVTAISPKDSSIIPRWMSDPLPLFRRLSIHALGSDSQLTANDKIARIIEAQVIYDHHLKHEIFNLLAQVAAGLDDEHRRRLLDEVMKGPSAFNPVDETRYFRRSIFDILEWLTRFVEDWPELLHALDGLAAEEPDMGVREHPDLDYYMTSGVWGGRLPYEIDEFVRFIQNSGARGALLELLNRDYSERDFDQPAWEDAMSLITRVVQAHPDLGHDLIDEVGSIPAELQRQENVTDAILQGWAEARLSDAQLESTAARIAGYIDFPAHTAAIAAFLLGAVDSEDSRTDAHLARLDHIAQQSWTRYIDEYDPPDSDNWTTLGLNTWPGYIAQYWISRIRLRWRAHREDWKGLSQVEREALTIMLNGSKPSSRGAFAVITGDVFFLYAADPAFAAADVFPHFDGSIDDRAVQAWTSYLYRPRVDDRMLNDGFWQILIDASALATSTSRNMLEGQYWDLLASIAIQSTAEVIDRSTLIDDLANTSPAGLAQFLAVLASALGERNAQEVRRVWAQWLRQIVETRLQLFPGVLTSDEKSAWGDLALRCPPILEEALNLSDAAPGPIGRMTTFDDLTPLAVERHSDLITRAVTHRLQITPASDFHIQHELGELVQKLKSGRASKIALVQLVEAAIKIGIHDAGRWLDD
jgi:hypothetical protein